MSLDASVSKLVAPRAEYQKDDDDDANTYGFLASGASFTTGKFGNAHEIGGRLENYVIT